MPTRPTRSHIAHASGVTLGTVEREIRKQLKPGTPQQPTYADRYDHQRQRLRDAPASEGRAELARLGGVVKAWRHFLVQSITQAVLNNSQPGRERVRHWQQERFGQAQASGELQMYATGERSGGGRGEDVQLSPELNDACSTLFTRYKKGLKRPTG